MHEAILNRLRVPGQHEASNTKVGSAAKKISSAVLLIDTLLVLTVVGAVSADHS